LQPGARPLWGRYFPDPAIRLLVSVNAVDCTFRFFRLYVKHKFFKNLRLGPENLVVVKFTVMECLNPMNGNNLYSIEALDIILRIKNQDAWYD
jgi:hypothetical protein